jgi:hypothetical protein
MNPDIPRLPVPPYPARFRNQNDFGKRGMSWGTAEQAALDRRSELTREGLIALGVTLEMAQGWAQFYRNETMRNPANDSARGRAALMERAVQLLGGGT